MTIISLQSQFCDFLKNVGFYDVYPGRWCSILVHPLFSTTEMVLCQDVNISVCPMEFPNIGSLI